MDNTIKIELDCIDSEGIHFTEDEPLPLNPGCCMHKDFVMSEGDALSIFLYFIKKC